MLAKPLNITDLTKDDLFSIDRKICFLRHGDTLKSDSPQIYCSLKSIARATGLSAKIVNLLASNNLLMNE